MTMESGQHRSQPASAADLARTTTLSSTELWHEILERLREVQENQARLAAAIEGLGSEAQAKLGERGRRATLDRVPDQAPVPPVPGSDSFTDVGSGFKTSTDPADSLNTNVKASTQREWSGAAQVQEPLAATQVTDPVFYVPPFEEQVLPASSVAELTPDALDALLASEFGTGPVPRHSTATSAGAVTTTEPEGATHSDTRQPQPAEPESTAPNSDPGRVVLAFDPTNILDILLGTPRIAAEASPHTDAVAWAPPVSSPSSAVVAVPPPVFSDEAPTTSSVFIAEPDAAAPPTLATENAPPLPPPPPPPVFSDEAPPSSSVFITEPDAPAPPSLATENAPPLPPPPPPPPVFSDEAPPTSSVFTAEPADSLSSQPPPPIPPPPQSDTGEAPLFSFGTPHPEVLTSPPTPVLAEDTTSTVNGSQPLTPLADAADEDGATETSPQFTSTASMATEILSASPEIPIVDIAETSEAELISKDLTLIARERKKRFRLR
jgi:hypothetical protein